MTFVRAAPAGTALPPERELAIRLGVSRTTLRSAVDRLAPLGYLSVRHGSGTVVARPSAADLATPFRAAVGDVDGSMDGLLWLRQSLEPALAAAAAVNAQPADLPGLRDAATARDREFHLRVAQLSNNALAAQVVGVLVGMSGQRYVDTTRLDPRGDRVARTQHLSLVDAIEDGDAE